ncbi:MAG: FAD-binding protein, partial [Firmicutes bacterium]|nr:FAD-binding protein [Bacillota bacterium]
MAEKVGIFICGCRGAISGVVNLGKVGEGMAKVKKNVGAKVIHDFLCGPEGRETIINSVRENGIDCLLVAACPEDVHEDTFKQIAKDAGLRDGMLLRLDLREGCALAHKGNPVAATVKAINLIRMYNGRAKLMEPYAPPVVPGVKDVLIVGGGLAGLMTTIKIAEAGIPVDLFS